MNKLDWIWLLVAIVFALSILAYVVPGMILRAIRDFKRKYGKGEADVKKGG